MTDLSIMYVSHDPTIISLSLPPSYKDPDVLQSQSNEILTAIIHGMKKEETSEHVRLAATNALFNSLEFTRANFEKESERHYIMQVVCEASQSTNTQVRAKMGTG